MWVGVSGIGGIAISCATLGVLFALVKRHMMQRITVRLHKELLEHPEKSGRLMEETLDQLIESIKSQIPMGGMLLSGTIMEKLKAKLQKELEKVLPDLLPRIILQVKEPLQKEVSRTLKGYILPIAGVGFVLGALLGLLLFSLQGG